MPEWPDATHVPAEELVRRQGAKPIMSVAEMARPELFESDEELEEFLAELTSRAGLAREPGRPGHRRRFRLRSRRAELLQANSPDGTGDLVRRARGADALPLATLNTKDFVDFAQYDGLNLIDLS